MEKNIIIFGATGNAGGQVLTQALADNKIAKVTSISRRPSEIKHEKLYEVIHQNFLDFTAIEEVFKNQEICIYCLGVSQLQVKEETEYKKITHDFTMAAVNILLKYNKDLTLCYLSGEGADPSMRSKTLFARIKGMTENSLSALPIKNLHIFRPAYIHPVNLGRKKNTIEKVGSVLYPIMKYILPNMVITSEILGKVMIDVGCNGHNKKILDNKKIKYLGQMHE